MDTARERLLAGSESSFDPQLLRAFLQLLDLSPNFTVPQRLCAITVDADTLPLESQARGHHNLYTLQHSPDEELMAQ
jgi:hypothetical protein